MRMNKWWENLWEELSRQSEQHSYRGKDIWHILDNVASDYWDSERLENMRADSQLTDDSGDVLGFYYHMCLKITKEF